MVKPRDIQKRIITRVFLSEHDRCDQHNYLNQASKCQGCQKHRGDSLCPHCSEIYAQLCSPAQKIANNHDIITAIQYDQHRRMLPSKCEVCGHNVIIDVHHVDHDRSNNMMRNLLPLCPTHHMMIHRGNYTLSEVFNHEKQGLPPRLSVA